MGRLEKNISAANKRPGKKFKIMLSIGTVFQDHHQAHSIDELMIQADKLMYKNKRKKKSSDLYHHM